MKELNKSFPLSHINNLNQKNYMTRESETLLMTSKQLKFHCFLWPNIVSNKIVEPCGIPQGSGLFSLLFLFTKR